MKATRISPSGRPLVFVSYSREDKRWLDELRTMLAPLLRNRIVDVWWDGKIKPSQEWRGEIERALTSAGIGVLLVSPSFLASDFIAREELPYLIAAARERKVALLWVLLSPCLWEQTPLRDVQAAHDLSRPITGLKRVQRHEAWKEICQKIADAAEEASGRSTEAGAPAAEAAASSGLEEGQRTTGNPEPPVRVPPPPSGSSKGIPYRSLFAVLLLVFLAGAGLAWHLFPWYLEKVGNTAGVLGPVIVVGGFIFGLLKILVGEDDARNTGRKLLRKMDRSRLWWRLFWPATGALIYLLLASNSVYVQLRQEDARGTDPAEPRLQFSIREKGRPAWPAAEVSRDEPLFFRFTPNWSLRRRMLSLDIVKPDYKPIEKTLWPGLSARFKVPPSPEDLYVIRIVPGRDLWDRLAPPSFPDASPCDLHVTVAGPGKAQAELPINLRASLTYVGAGREEDLKAAAQEQPDAEWKPDFCLRMQEEPADTTPPADCEHVLLEADPQYHEVAMGKDDVVSFRLTCSSRDGSGQDEIQVAEAIEAAEAGIRTIYLPSPFLEEP